MNSYCTNVYVDGCVIPSPPSAGIGVYCPSHPQMNAGEPLPRGHKFDINICELFAIIRGMERANNCHLHNISIITDSQQAYSVARLPTHEWPAHYNELSLRFKTAKSQLMVNFQLVSEGDVHHREADKLARQGAGKY